MKSTSMPTDYLPLLERGRWFHGLPEDLKQWLLAAALVRPLAPGQRLFARGDEPCGLYVVVAGALRVSGYNDEGREAMLTIVEAPNWLGEIALFDRQARTHDAVAEGEAVVLQVPQKALDRMLLEQPQYWREFGLLMTHKLRLSFQFMEDMALLPAAVRLARRMVMMAEGYGDLQDRSKRVIGVSQEQIAMMVAISRQTTNQILKEFEAQGILHIAYGKIEILDMAKLRAKGKISVE